MSTNKSKSTVSKTPVKAKPETPPDYFVPPGYATHVVAYKRNGVIQFNEFKYKRRDVIALIKWLGTHTKSLVDE